VGVFAVFGTLRLIEFKQMGVGLAAAILIDATIIRGVLLPATLAVLGERAWYLPRWMQRPAVAATASVTEVPASATCSSWADCAPATGPWSEHDPGPSAPRASRVGEASSPPS
jgi:uncharacterized membrane protein YdfJ with MMPL/SSD domain